MIFLFLWLFCTFSIMTSFAEEPFCYYDLEGKELLCGSFTCSTSESSSGLETRTEPGLYRIGKFHFHSWSDDGWFNLYPFRDNHPDEYWNYDTNAPDRKCKGNMALHEGRNSDGCKGCITIEVNTEEDESCWENLSAEIKRQVYQLEIVKNCVGCNQNHRGGYSCDSETNQGEQMLGPIIKVH